MAALPHKTGKFRAYKCIGGAVFQCYFNTLEAAEAKQVELDKLCSLRVVRQFNKEGYINGFRIGQENKKDRPMTIFMRMQLIINGKKINKQFKYEGNFEQFWLKILKLWKTSKELTSADVATYKNEIKIAKRLYIQDVGRLEDNMRP